MKYFALLILLTYLNTFSQNFDLREWRLQTSYTTPTSAAIDSEGKLWVSTTGGVYSYDPADSTYNAFNKLNGLSDLFYTSIISIPEIKLIIAGSNQGNIDIISEDSDEILNITDLRNFSSVGAKINSMNYHNGIVYICSSIGLSEFMPSQGGDRFSQIFGDTYQRNELISSIILRDSIFIQTKNDGIFKTKLGNIITDPTNWEQVNLMQATGSQIDSMMAFQDDIYFYNTEAVWRRSLDTVELVAERDLYEILQLIEFDNSIEMVTDFSRTDLINGDEFFDFDFKFDGAFNYPINGEENFLFLSELDGVRNYSDEKSALYPNSLGSNLIFEIDTKGEEIWATTGQFGTMYFDGDIWRYYYTRLENIWGDFINGNGQRAIHISDNGNVYIGHKGLGLFEVRSWGDSLAFLNYNDTNSIFRGIYELPEDYQKGDEIDLFTESAQILTDENNVVWAINNGVDFKGYALIAKDGEDFYGFAENPGGLCGQNSRGYYHLVIDDQGTKWLGSDESSEVAGILLYNERGTLEDTSDDLCMVLRTNNVSDLPNNRITALEIDKNGWVWVGTPTGVAYFLNPSAIEYSNDPEDLIGVTAQIFDGINVVDIKVDAVNNKWIASPDEIKIFDPDGTELIGTINSNNSPLPETGITTMHMLEESGEVLIGTQSGLFTVKTLNPKPLEAYDINIYPQPFNPNIHSEIRFEGLAADSELKIIKPNGEIVHTFRAKGREAIWNGRKENGIFVNSGVYLVVTASEKNGARSVGKFAIIKK
jgi:ligand-binding sensor domain-containing protein